MNAVEIEEAVSLLAEQPFEPDAFPYAFLEAFGNKATTIARLRKGGTNKSDCGGLLQHNNIHILVCEAGHTAQALDALRASPATARARAKFILATDGAYLEAEHLASGDTIACEYRDFPDHFGFFLPLAGISTVRQISESAFDIKATGRLNRLYVELLKTNPDWGSGARRHDMNHFMARLIFCFFAEDTGIFPSGNSFTEAVERMSAPDASNTHQVISALFAAMNTREAEREAAHTPRWARSLPYVNGALFAGSVEVPRFTKIARSYLLHIGKLDWTKINPDIFGSMIQAVADDAERGSLGMHYTSVPNILKVLNPLFLDALREKLQSAGNNAPALHRLRERLARIRVFDPACGSGNFLVIAYKELRAIEAEINQRLGDADRASAIPLSNFRGIEIRDFAAEIARLALIIAEYQCDVRHRGHELAIKRLLPLDKDNWITCGNALRLDWLHLCPPAGTGVKLHTDDLLHTPLTQSEIDFENEGGEVYICGNPPYLGSTWQSAEQKDDLRAIFERRTKHWKSLDYVAGWFMKAADYGDGASAAFVATNSICQGQQVAILWPLIFGTGHQIFFAHTSFKWANLAAHNAGVTVVIVGISADAKNPRLFTETKDGKTLSAETPHINAYLVAGRDIIVKKETSPLSTVAEMSFGNKPVDGGNLLLSLDEAAALGLSAQEEEMFVRRIYGSAEYIRGTVRKCLWITDDKLPQALQIPSIRRRIDAVREIRIKSKDAGAREMAARAHQFREMREGAIHTIIIPAISSENREYLPVGLLPPSEVVTNKTFALYDAPLWNMAIIASRLHWVWIASVCVRLEMRFSYSNTLGWNTFPVPFLTEKNIADLTRCAENILLAREHHFPATIADLYAPGAMPEDLRAAHEHNDEVLERIYIGRRFRNDSERLEKLFAMYAEMAPAAAPKKPKGRLRKTEVKA